MNAAHYDVVYYQGTVFYSVRHKVQASLDVVIVVRQIVYEVVFLHYFEFLHGIEVKLWNFAFFTVLVSCHVVPSVGESTDMQFRQSVNAVVVGSVPLFA